MYNIIPTCKVILFIAPSCSRHMGTESKGVDLDSLELGIEVSLGCVISEALLWPLLIVVIVLVDS